MTKNTKYLYFCIQGIRIKCFYHNEIEKNTLKDIIYLSCKKRLISIKKQEKYYNNWIPRIIYLFFIYVHSLHVELLLRLDFVFYRPDMASHCSLSRKKRLGNYFNFQMTISAAGWLFRRPDDYSQRPNNSSSGHIIIPTCYSGGRKLRRIMTQVPLIV